MRYSLDTDTPPEIKEFTKGMVDNFIRYLLDTDTIKSRTNTRVRECTTVINVFYNNLYRHASVNKSAMLISLNDTTYSKPFICNGRASKTKVSYTYTKRFFEYLESEGLATIKKGYAEFDTYRSKGVYKYRVTDFVKSTLELSYKLQQKGKELVEILDFIPIRNVIVLRDKNKNDRTFKMPSNKVSIKNTLIKFNGYMSKKNIRDPLHSKDYILQLTKIFNTTFDRGGRMYDNGIQNLSKSERKRLTIDEKTTCIYDYKAFETSLIYSVQGEVMEGDPYKVKIEGYDNTLLREIGKMVMTRIYYCKDRSELQASVSKSVQDKFNLTRLHDQGKIPEKRIPVGVIIDLLMDKHECIMEHFFLDSDYDPSHLGSLVMDYVLEYMIQNYDAGIIPVFDEVICEKEYEFELQEVMKRAYEFVVGTDKNCYIVKEK
ncbi:hypothetical protein NVP1170O_033 [Vibrio phage 1.170.O._10N.261.52.C3]|nr:hypothetical protein NVP1170O_033 [Vibrio phage 1.170.O._10N.261.52.C3]